MGNKEKARVPSVIGNWHLEQALGAGYSGSIWRARHVHSGQVAALKVQDVNHERPTNRYERNFYPSLQGGVGMPTLWASGVQGNHDYLVIDLLGASLDSLYRKNNKRLDLRSTLCIAMQVIQRLELMHARGILHRDIQLGNCVLGLGDKSHIIYMIDFGFSKRFIDPRTRQHIPDSREKRDFIGNYWFSSVNVHCRNRVPSRKDDMEALALMLIHVLTDRGLPWTRNGVPKTDNQHEALMQIKISAQPDRLCRGLPSVFEEFLRYCRRLKFLDQPDYQYWREQFAELARKMGYVEADGTVSDAFIWPPKLDEAFTLHAKSTISGHGQTGTTDKELARMLATLHLKPAQELVQLQKTQLALASRNSQVTHLTREKSSQGHSKDSQISSGVAEGLTKVNPNTIDVHSDDGYELFRRADRYTKRATMTLLQHQGVRAWGARELADLIHRFTETLKSMRSKVITIPAFFFLEIVAEQIANPSVIFATSDPPRGKDGRQVTLGRGEGSRIKPPYLPKRKGETVKDLRYRLLASSMDMNKAELGFLLIGFVHAVRATPGKTLTKNGVAFLEAFELKLRS